MALQAAGRLRAVHLRHPQVHQHDIGPVLAGHANRFLAVRGSAHDVDVGQAVQQADQAFPHHAMVFCD